MASKKTEASEAARALRSQLYRNILRTHWMQGTQPYFDSLNMENALRHGQNDVLNCGDGGTPGFARLPVILTETDRVVAFCRASGVEAIHRHHDCGAETVFARHHGLDHKDALDLIDEWYAHVAERTRLPIGETPILRPEGFHPEPIVVYDAVGLNPAKLPGAPLCFHVSRGYYPYDREGAHDAAGHCGFYTDIMFSEHGLGERLNPHTPGIILVVGNPSIGLPYEKLKEELAGIGNHRLGRLVVVGFNYHSPS